MADKPLVFLAFGHGGSDPGACAFGMKEKDINLVVGLACRDELIRHGVDVKCSRLKDEKDPVQDEVAEAIACGCDLAAAFHANAGRGDGFEAFCNLKNPDGVEICEFAEEFVKELGQNSRGIKDGTHLYFIRKTPMTSVLFEGFFLDNDTDNDIGDTAAEQKGFGVAYAKAILKHLEIQYNPVNGTAEKTTTTDKLYRVYEQKGAFGVKANAEKLQIELQKAGKIAIII